MAISNRISSSYRSFLVLVIALFLAGESVVRAQTPTPRLTATPSPSANVSPSSSPSPSPTKSPEQSPATTPSPVDIRAKLLESSWYPLVVSLLFGVLLLGFAATIARVILRSKSSFRSPLGLPEGSLRAMLAFLLVAFLGFYVYASVLSLSDFQLPQALLGIIATVIGFYFGSRSVEGAAAGARLEQTGSVEGSVLDNNGTPAGGATVDLSQAGVKKFTQPADLSGKFKFDDVPIGDYDIQASKSDHTPSDPAKVKVTTGRTQTVNLKLK